MKTSNCVSPAKQRLSPTMAAFTPTSVMRKMHSERQEKDSKSDGSVCEKTPGSPESKSSIETNNDMLQINGNSNLISLMPTDGNISSSYPSNHHSMSDLSRGISVGGNVSLGPRAVYGQGSLNQNRPHNQIGIPGQGRPIVKGGNPSTNGVDHFNRGLASNKSLIHNKQFLGGNSQTGHLLRPDLNVGFAKLMEQRLIQQQQVAAEAALRQAAQRQLNTSPMPPMAIPPSAFGLGPRVPGITPSTNLVQPTGLNLNPSVGAASLNSLPLLRTMMQANPALRAQTTSLTQLTQLGQIAALQQQLRDPRQLQTLAQARGLHPVALQQLLLNAQNQTNATNPQATNFRSQAITGNALNMIGGRSIDNNLLGAAAIRSQLAPGQPQVNRQSPVNLSKWFGNDVLKQKMPEMPPVPLQNALLVEEVERQQQTTVVHN